jgi:hypothetical protein
VASPERDLGLKMPIGRWGLGLARARFAVERGWARGAVVAVAAICALFYLVSALWFDVAYWLLGRFAARRVGRRARAGISIAFAVLVVATLSASAAKPAVEPTNSPVAAALATPGPSLASRQVATSIAPATTPTVEVVVASPTPGDVDDEAGPSSAPGASFTAEPTGVVSVPLPQVSSADRLPGEPDPALTPGALNPAVTQSTIGSTICVSGWTATIRPPSSYTTALKIDQVVAYGYSDTSTAAYEEDHLIPLELGGAPADPRNLWPQPYTASLADGRPTGAHVKDGFETKLKNEVCAGTITLAQAQSEIGDRWVHAYYDIAITSSTPTPAPATEPPTALPTQPPTAAPTPEPVATDPYADAKAAGATAVCADRTWSFSKTRSGTCSGHGGVHWWTGNVGAPGPGAH